MNIYKYIILLGFLASCKPGESRLPILGRGVIPAFHLLNQDSVTVTNKDFDGSIYVADFFFTTCPTICPIMHRNLLKVYTKYKGNKEVKLLSHTIDVKYDTPSRLKAYANKLGVEGTQWEFLWGSREAIYTLAQKSYLVSVNEDKNGPGGFVHQGYLVLIDKKKRIRGAYDGTLEKEVAQLMTDMDLLLKEK
jgi:protein SCO1/2